MNIYEFADVIRRNIVITYYHNQNGRFCARFEHCETQDGCMLMSEFANGRTPESAVEEYAKTISGKTIVFDAMREYEQTFQVPELHQKSPCPRPAPPPPPPPIKKTCLVKQCTPDLTIQENASMLSATKPEDTMRIISICMDVLSNARQHLQQQQAVIVATTGIQSDLLDACCIDDKQQEIKKMDCNYVVSVKDSGQYKCKTCKDGRIAFSVGVAGRFVPCDECGRHLGQLQE